MAAAVTVDRRTRTHGGWMPLPFASATFPFPFATIFGTGTAVVLGTAGFGVAAGVGDAGAGDAGGVGGAGASAVRGTADSGGRGFGSGSLAAPLPRILQRLRKSRNVIPVVEFDSSEASLTSLGVGDAGADGAVL